MCWCRTVVAICFAAGCSFTQGSLGLTGDDMPDATLDGDPDASNAFPTGPFGTPVLVVPVSGVATRDDDVTLTSDMLEMYFESDILNAGDGDVYVSKRASVGDVWSLPARVNELSTLDLETSMEVSPDGLAIYFSSNRSPSQLVDVWVSKRDDRLSTWSAPTRVTALNSTSSEWNAQPWSETLLYLGSNRPGVMGSSDVFRSTRGTSTDTWSTPATIPGLDTIYYEGEAFADATGAIWFTGNLPGTSGLYDLWRSAPVNGVYQAPERISDVASPNEEADAWLSPDGHTLYFTSNRGGTYDIYVATR